MCAVRRRVYPCESREGVRIQQGLPREALDREKGPDRACRIVNPISERLRRGKNRAVKLGRPADAITLAEVVADWKRRDLDPERCVYTGEPLRDRSHIDHGYPLSCEGSPAMSSRTWCRATEVRIPIKAGGTGSNTRQTARRAVSDEISRCGAGE